MPEATKTKVSTNMSELTKEVIGELYIVSIGNPETRKMHTRLAEARSGPTPVAPSVHDAELDFKCWYSGLQSLAHAIDPGVDLPPTQNMVGFITQNFERVKSSIAA
jgi:hypothetical protein